MSIYTYDNTDIVLMIAGFEVKGFGENKVTITRNNDVSTIIEGLDGNMFAKSSRKAGTLSFELLYGSDSDTIMDQLSGVSKLVPVNFMHKGSLKVLNTSGMIMSQPDIVLGDEPENREWVMHIDNAAFDAKSQVTSLTDSAKYYTPV